MTTDPTAVGGTTSTVADAADDRERRQRIERALAELDLSNTNAIMTFGTKAQHDLVAVADSMLEGVRGKDAGPAGSALGDMLATLRGFDVSEIDPNKRPGLLGRLFGAATPLARFLQRYEQVRAQIDAIGDRLDQHKSALMVDIAQLDRLYAANLAYFRHLADYIAAGDEMLRRLDEETLPALAREAETSGDVIKAQELRDLRTARDDLERRVHDLKLTRQVAMQSLPSIRLVQENDKSLVNKITSVLANTVPLWRTQLAQAITIYRSHEAGRTLKDATDLTNELLTANAETLKQANAEIRRQIERGAFDIERVKQANALLIETIEDSLRIAREGKQKRAEAETQLKACEAELRAALAAVAPRQPPSGVPAAR